VSIIFGIHDFRCGPVYIRELEELAVPTASYSSSKGSFRSHVGIGMGFQPYYTHQRSNLEFQPVIDPNGNMLTFDGRLDNHQELIAELDMPNNETADSLVIMEAFQRWGENCFGRFIGDWALALWSRHERSLYLVRDHAGTRTLYFGQAGDRVLWSTYLDTFFMRGRVHELNRAYAARYLAGLPLLDLTPYRDIQGVPPAHFVRLCAGRVTRHCHWRCMIPDKLRYTSAVTYEDHFLDLFGRSVMRRTGPGVQVTAELSGGMDSSSIVCMSDNLRRSGGSSADLIDTVSFYDDTEPAWDEKPFFSIVEQHRGKTGIHIDTSRGLKSYEPLQLAQGLPVLPGLDDGSLNLQRDVERRLGAERRVILSGIGGDELLGGVPSGLPELGDLLIAGRFGLLLRRTIAWCLVDRSPLLAMLGKTADFALHLYRQPSASTAKLPPWIPRRVGEIAMDAGFPNPRQMQHIGMSPSTIDNGLTWWRILETLPHLYPSNSTRREYRFPYLDRELVEFLHRVPRHILLNPGRRRALMRTALRNIVPDAVLERKRKAYVVRKHLSSLANEHEKLRDLLLKPRLADYGLASPAKLMSVLEAVVSGEQINLWPSLTRSISFELWLRSKPAVLN
jgi:asparagine synthase (glutamine-hydrolysing)